MGRGLGFKGQMARADFKDLFAKARPRDLIVVLVNALVLLSGALCKWFEWEAFPSKFIEGREREQEIDCPCKAQTFSFNWKAISILQLIDLNWVEYKWCNIAVQCNIEFNSTQFNSIMLAAPWIEFNAMMQTLQRCNRLQWNYRVSMFLFLDCS